MKTGVSIQIMTSKLLSQQKITLEQRNQLKQWKQKHANRTIKPLMAAIKTSQK